MAKQPSEPPAQPPASTPPQPPAQPPAADAGGSIRIYDRHLACPDCGARYHTHTRGDYLVDVSKPVTCRRCSKVISADVVKASTRALTKADRAANGFKE